MQRNVSQTNPTPVRIPEGLLQSTPRADLGLDSNFIKQSTKPKIKIDMKDFNEYFQKMLDPIITESIQKNLLNGFHDSNTNSFPEFLTQDQAAAYLGISKSALYAMTSKNEITYFKKGRRNYFKRPDLRNWIESGRIKSISEIKEEIL